MKKVSIHREGYTILLVTGLGLLLINAIAIYLLQVSDKTAMAISLLSAIIFFFVLYFFRIPRIEMAYTHGKQIIAPADGKIVVVEEVEETEYFKDRRIQVSIFMSPTNVHVNRSPVAGTVTYTKYHPGNYLVAWHPKSSTLNERFTSVIQNVENDYEILVRQIAGKLARKITNYLDEGDEINKGEELGFIKFGSRVDLYLPLDAVIKINLKEKVKGGKTVLAELP